VLVQRDPSLVLLARDEVLAGLPLRVERIEVLFQPFLAALARIDRAARRLFSGQASARSSLDPAAFLFATGTRLRPKKVGPFQLVPVIAFAMAESDA
jgi:hypothetical protein